MATIASLAVKITANAAKLLSTLAGSVAAMKEFGKGVVTDIVTPLAKGVPFAVAGAVVALTGLATVSAHTAVQLNKTAREIGVATGAIMELQFAAKQVAVDANLVPAALADLQRTLVAATSGSSATADAFNRLGLSAKTLAGVPVESAFLDIADAIKSIADPTLKAALATQIFGDKAAALLPLLNLGSKGMLDSAETAKALGLSIENVHADMLEQAGIAMSNLGDIAKGLGLQIAVSLAPYLQVVAELLTRWISTSVNAGKVVSKTFEIVATVVAYAVSIWQKFSAGIRLVQGLVGVLAGVFMQLAGGIGRAVAMLLRFEFLGQSSLADTLDKASDQLIKWGDNTAKLATRIGRQARQDFDKPFSENAENVHQFFNGVNESVNKISTGLAEQARQQKTANGAVAEANRMMELFKRGSAVFNEVKTPLQSFQDKMSELDKLIQSGAISWDTYARGAAKAVEELEKAHQLQELKLPNAVTRNSAEAQSAIVRDQQLQDFRRRESPADRAARIMEQSVEIEKKQLEYQGRMAEALLNRPQEITMNG